MRRRAANAQANTMAQSLSPRIPWAHRDNIDHDEETKVYDAVWGSRHTHKYKDLVYTYYAPEQTAPARETTATERLALPLWLGSAPGARGLARFMPGWNSLYLDPTETGPRWIFQPIGQSDDARARSR